MKNKMKVMLILISLIIIIPMVTFASELILNVKIDKSQYKVGDTVIATVDWTEKMQAASFVIKYDSDILEFKSSSIAETFYNADNKGEISINWASLEEKNLTKVIFEFITLKTGNADISIKNIDGFSDGNMKTPTDYEFTSIGKVNVSANDNNDNSNEMNTKNTSNETKNIENTPKAYSSKDEESITNTKLPNAGVSTFIIPILMISLLGIIGYIKYKRLSGI